MNVVRTLFAGLCFHTAGAALQEQEPEPEPEPEEEEWRPKSDPRLARVVELEESGEAESAARLLRTLLASLDPHRTKPKLHAHLAKVSSDALLVCRSSYTHHCCSWSDTPGQRRLMATMMATMLWSTMAYTHTSPS